MWPKISWRLLKHELRRGELTIMAAAVALAVTAVLSLSVFSERLQLGLLDRSSEFLAADRVLRARGAEIPTDWLDRAEQENVAWARRVTFNSMAFTNGEMTLVDVKSVSDGYPLRGHLEVASAPYMDGDRIDSLPQAGEVWVQGSLFQALALDIGSVLEIGDAEFTVTHVLSHQPDSGFNVFADSPTVLIHIDELERTGLIQPGSRVNYNYLFAGDPSDIQRYETWLLPQLDDVTQRWTSIQDGDSPLSAALNRAERFMLLASLLGVVLAATAVAVAAQRYAQRNFDAVAIMKTLGGRTPQITRIFTLHLLLLTGVSIVLGLILGNVLQYGVIWWVSEQLGYALPSGGSGPYVLAVATGLLCALMFSLYPLLRLLKIPPLRVLRRDIVAQGLGKWLHWLIAGSTIFLLMVIYSGSLMLSVALFAGGVVAMLLLLAISRLFIRASRSAGMQAGSSWRLAMAGLQRRAAQNSMQMLSFSIAIMLFLLVLALRNELLDDWQNQLPEDAPNYFVVNVAPHQVAPMQEMFAAESIQATELYPIVPGRLVAINGTMVRDAVTKEERDESEFREGFGRELQLTWQADLPAENRILQGEWFSPGKAGVSVESQVAERINVRVGDELTFRVAADEFTVPITNIREVDWNTMQPNFYMVFSPDLLEGMPATYIASFHLPPERRVELYRLFRDFPQASLIDVEDILTQIRDVIGHVSLAITFVMVLVIFAGALVLVAQVQASLDERRQELVILRTLGARSSLLSRAVSYEFVVLGALAGLIATIAMEVAVYALQTQVFNMQPTFHWRFWLLGPSVGAVIVAALGWSVCYRLLQHQTGALIRRLQ
ncbi:FtsX-like permease family protein [Aliidiomarina halalkaliphila]|uniref:FtsX-like permease family protein n=1 Tax=Aliidiomarina halalkaliphila TaxID=2593535 RepID=A0A552X671_9GAMM|nr:FtsX-like permease family protein [Aliidiomarina halalkaliphila]TRW50073.1 FtsX-like permease family protein [Aliidiomarina halalkaliphila]